MTTDVTLDTVKFTWGSVAKTAALCFSAGMLYMVVQANSASITKVIDNQTSSTERLNQSISSLDLTMVQLKTSMKSSDAFIQEIRLDLKEQAKIISMNQLSIAQLKELHKK